MPSAGEILFAAVYTLFCSYLILRLPLFKSFDLSLKLITAIFLFKVLTTIIYGLIHSYFLPHGGDTFDYFNDAAIVRESLSEDPLIFLKLVFGINTRPPAPDIIRYAQAMSYWNDMGSYFMVRFHALASLITGNHYYANSVIYNFLTLIGMLFLFQFFYEITTAKKIALIAALFFFPSVTFWASGIHKDGISIAALGLILYFISPFINPKILNGKTTSFPVKNIIFVLAGIWLLFIVRTYLLMLLIPCLAGYIWISKYPKIAALKLFLVLSICFFFAFNLKLLNPEWDLLGKMWEQQLEFSKMTQGLINLQIREIQPGALSLIQMIPQALANCLFRPGIWEIKSAIQIVTAVDNLLLLLLIVFSVFYKKKIQSSENALFLFSSCFSLLIFIFVGSIVPNAGALVRYRTPGLLFLVVALLLLIDEKKIKWFRENR